MEGHSEYEYIHRPFCAECGSYFATYVEGETVKLITLKCSCVKERVYVADDWLFMEHIGHGLGMTCLIHRLVDFDKGEGTHAQKVDAFVREHFGDQSECDKSRALEIMRTLTKGRV